MRNPVRPSMVRGRLPDVPHHRFLAHDEHVQAPICAGGNRRCGIQRNPGRSAVRNPLGPTIVGRCLGRVPERSVVA